MHGLPPALVAVLLLCQASFLGIAAGGPSSSSHDYLERLKAELETITTTRQLQQVECGAEPEAACEAACVCVAACEAMCGAAACEAACAEAMKIGWSSTC